MNYMSAPGIDTSGMPVIRNYAVEEYFYQLCRAMQVTPEFIKQQSRKRDVVECRQKAMYCIRKRFPLYSLKHLGELFGGFDHTTVIHSVHTVSNIRSYDFEYRAELDLIYGCFAT